MKRKMIKWEKTLANHISNKRLITKIYKEFTQLNRKKKGNQKQNKTKTNNSNKEKQFKNWDPNSVHECLVA